MKKTELTNQIVRFSRLSRAAAADQLDRMVEEILRGVRGGEAANIPGLGTFRAGQEVVFSPEGSSKPAARKGRGPAVKSPDKVRPSRLKAPAVKQEGGT